MKFTLDANTRVNLIKAYSLTEIRIGERSLNGSCIVTADALIENWRADAPEDLTAEKLEPLFALRPELVLLGTGKAQRFPPAAVRAAFVARGIGLEAMDLGAACRTFNILVQEDRRVAAALLLEPRVGEENSQKTQGEKSSTNPTIIRS